MKRFNSRFISLFLGVALIIGLVPMNAFAAKKISLSKKKVTIYKGKTKVLKVKNLKKKQKVKWKITAGKKKIKLKAKKRTSVKIVAKKVGKAKVVAVIGKKKYTCVVTVKKKATTASASPDSSVSVSASPNVSASPANTVTPSDTSSPAATADASASASGEPKDTASPTDSAEPTDTASPTDSGEPADTASPANSGEPTDTASPAASASGLVGDVTFSKTSGVYDSAFDLAISSAKGETIYYTTDGSDPRTSDTRIKYESPINVKDRSTEANVLAAIDPNLFETMNYTISGKNVYSTMSAPSATVDKCTVVKAASVGSSGQTSDVVTNTYFVGAIGDHIDNAAESAVAYSKGLAIMSISFEDSDLFDEQDGIYMKGKYFDESLQAYLDAHNNSLSGISVESDLTANFKQRGSDWEKPCHIDYFETDGTTTDLKLSQDCGIRIQGNYSRECIQKSFRLYARADYGEEYGTAYIKKNFTYPFFDNVFNDDGDLLSKYKTIVLRDGGNDYQNYKYKDILMQSFADDMAVQNIHGRPCVVYLDGEYWGYYVMQDDISDNLLGELHGVDNKSILSYKATDLAEYKDYGYKLDEGDIPEGEDVDYYLAPTLDYLQNNEMADETNYNTFMSTYMSEDSVVDYFALELYLGNRWDWPSKNWQIWKVAKTSATNEYADDKWRFCLNDLDLTTEPTWSQNGNSYTMDVSTNLYDTKSKNVLCIMFTNLIRNETFREKLYARMKELSENNYSYSNVNARAKTYKTMYSVLFDQCSERFVFPYAIGEDNHKANLNYIKYRPAYIDSVITSMRNSYDDIAEGSSNLISGGGDFKAADDFEELELTGSECIWEGSWTRGANNNYTSKLTKGFTAYSESANFIRFHIPDEANITNAKIKVSVASGYASNARVHIWDADKEYIDSYIYENENAWIDQEIDLNGLGSGEDFYINTVDATMVKVVVSEK